MALAQLDNVTVLPTRGGYGDFSHIERYVETLQWLLENEQRFDWVINISGQDYPLLNLRHAEDELSRTHDHALMQTFPVFSPASHWSERRASERYRYRYRRLASVTPLRQRLARPLAVANYAQSWFRFSPAYLGIGRRASVPLADSDIHGGSFFANLSRDAALRILRVHDEQPELVEWARHTLAPEEMFFQTVLHNTPGMRIRNDCKRYFDFEHSRGNHPKMLTLRDLPAMLASGAWFGRKIDADTDWRVLDALDERAQ